MSSASWIIAAARSLGDLPAPNVLLFPNMVVPLHNFEERYKRNGEAIVCKEIDSWVVSCCDRWDEEVRPDTV